MTSTPKSAEDKPSSPERNLSLSKKQGGGRGKAESNPFDLTDADNGVSEI
jgi:hypothetical protein